MSANDLLESYLSNRKQYVQINGISSSIVSINIGSKVQMWDLSCLIYLSMILTWLVINLIFILYADDNTLNATVESFGETAADIQLSIGNKLQKICKWLDLNKLHLNVAISKFMFFHMPQKGIPPLHFSLNGSPIDYATKFNYLGLTLDCNLNFKSHLKTIGTYDL